LSYLMTHFCSRQAWYTQYQYDKMRYLHHGEHTICPVVRKWCDWCIQLSSHVQIFEFLSTNCHKLFIMIVWRHYKRINLRRLDTNLFSSPKLDLASNSQISRGMQKWNGTQPSLCVWNLTSTEVLKLRSRRLLRRGGGGGGWMLGRAAEHAALREMNINGYKAKLVAFTVKHSWSMALFTTCITKATHWKQLPGTSTPFCRSRKQPASAPDFRMQEEMMIVWFACERLSAQRSIIDDVLLSNQRAIIS
jgi:hypothetical protein